MNIFLVVLFLTMGIGLAYKFFDTGCIGPRPGAMPICGSVGLISFCIITSFFAVSIFFLLKNEFRKRYSSKDS